MADVTNENEARARAAHALRRAVQEAGRGLVEREVLVELIVLGAIAQEHVLVIGEPGTAKSAAVRRVTSCLGGNYFEYLLGRFTEPSEVFGPVDLSLLQQGKVETRTTGMLPEAEIAFLDEVFQGSSAILNTLLGILNERLFRRGHSLQRVPLRLCVGASNALPDSPSLAAFADRFLLRVFVAPVADSELESLLSAGRSAPAISASVASLADLDVLAGAVEAVDLSGIEALLAQAIRTLRRAGILLSDRRIVRAQRLIAAAAALDGRERATGADLWPLVYVVPTAAEQDSARDALHELLQQARSPLSAAALDASHGAQARAARIALSAEALLSATVDAGERVPWQLKLEALGREIDASFSPQALPPELGSVRARIAQALA